MNVQIKTPCRDGANDKTHTKITSHKHCTKNRLANKPLCDNYLLLTRNNTMTFEEFIYNLGLGRQKIISDGEIHRFKPPGSKTNSGWYISYPHFEYEAGVAGDWRTDLQESFCSINKSKFTLEQRRQYAQRNAKSAAQRKDEAVKRYTIAKKEVDEVWGKASTEDLDSHPYLVNKQIKAFNVRIDYHNNLLIPMYDSNHIMWNIQKISPNGYKKFHKGARIDGCYHPIGFLNNVLPQIVLCEGPSTGMSIYQAIGIPTVVCFGARKLENIAKIFRTKYPNSKIIIAGDDDQFNSVNIGRIKALITSKKTNSFSIFPKFKDLSVKPSDFNDLHCLEGLEVVRKQFIGVCDVF
jgi:putative DNA primase/helicase